MKQTNILVLFLLTLFSSISYAHHPAADVVDADIYEMIDSMVADTPHAEMTFDDMGSSMETTVTSSSIVTLDNMLEDGLMSYVGMLEGDVSVSIDFNTDNSVTMVINQIR